MSRRRARARLVAGLGARAGRITPASARLLSFVSAVGMEATARIFVPTGRRGWRC